MSVQIESHSTLCSTYRVLCIFVRQPITEVKAEWNAAADVRENDCTYALTINEKPTIKSNNFAYILLRLVCSRRLQDGPDLCDGSVPLSVHLYRR